MESLEFDLDKYLRASKRVDLSDVEWGRIPEHPVTEHEARLMTYMMDIETTTILFERDLLATRAAYEPDITAFLSCWAYEEYWHGEAFSRFLGEAGYKIPPAGEAPRWEAPYPSKVERDSWLRRHVGSGGPLAYVGTVILSALVKDFAAVHMTWGAINEMCTFNGYKRMMAITGHPVLADMVGRIMKDEARHYAFYRNQALLRLERSPAARRVTRWIMNRLWVPVGTGVRPQRETDFLIAYLYGGPSGDELVREMDASIHDLPGLGGLNLIRREVDAAVRRAGPVYELHPAKAANGAVGAPV